LSLGLYKWLYDAAKKYYFNSNFTLEDAVNSAYLDAIKKNIRNANESTIPILQNILYSVRYNKGRGSNSFEGVTLKGDFVDTEISVNDLEPLKLVFINHLQIDSKIKWDKLSLSL
jgi:hypothetical protein